MTPAARRHKRKRPKSQRGMGRAMGQNEKRSAEARTMQERRADAGERDVTADDLAALVGLEALLHAPVRAGIRSGYLMVNWPAVRWNPETHPREAYSLASAASRTTYSEPVDP